MTNQGKSQPLFISLIPNLMGGEGHIIPYHQAVAKSAKTLGWEHLVLMPTNSPNALFAQQRSCLFDANLEAAGNAIAKLFRIKLVLELAVSIIKALGRERENLERPTVIFIERFIHLQLLALAISIWFIPCQNLHIWILYRRDIHKGRMRYFYKLLNRCIQVRLEADKFHLLTDSEPLRVALSTYFQEEITVMPIPHTDIEFSDSLTKPSSNLPIICWWAGSPRTEKGWEVIRKLSQTPVNQGEKICLVAAKSSQFVPESGGIQLQLIQDQLSRQDYHQWFGKSDMILVPYDSEAYQERTSGIFTEAIIAGKIVLVTPHTWMAQELEKYHLQDLILDWNTPQRICDQILAIAVNPDIPAKLAQMQRDFQSFHSSENYTRILVSLLQK